MRISDWSSDVCSSDLTSAVGGATGAATGAVSGAANGAANIAGSVAGQGAASGNAAGSNAAASGAGALDAVGNVATTVNPGMVVKDAAGRTIGRVQSVKDGANGRIDSVLVKTSEGIAALPADQLSFSGSGLLRAMTRAEVRKMADEPSPAVNVNRKGGVWGKGGAA